MKRSYTYIIAIIVIIIGVFAFNYESLKVSYSAGVKTGSGSSIGSGSSHTCAVSGGYTIIFYSNGGSSVASQGAKLGTIPNPLPTPTRSGYTFAGWYIDKNLTKKIVTANDVRTYYKTDSYGCKYSYADFYAKWNIVTSPKPTNGDSCGEVTWTLNYETDGGSSITPQTVSGSNPTFNFPNPKKNGFVFGGWFKDPEFKEKATNNVNGINFTNSSGSNGCVNKTGTIYAMWVVQANIGPMDDNIYVAPSPNSGQAPNPGHSKPPEEKVVCENVIKRLHVDFDSNGGSELQDLDVCLDCSPETITLPQPEKEGKNFVGWYSDETLETQVVMDGLNTEVQLSQLRLSVDSLSNGCSSDLASTVLYARYEDIVCDTPDVSYLDINFVADDNTNEVNDVKKDLYDEKYYDLPILKKDEYIFGGWYIDSEYSRLVSKKINLVNAVKYMNVTRDFENNCSTDTISTILYAKWIPLDQIENVRILFLANGNIVADKIYNRNEEISNLPRYKEKGLKLDGWYTDGTYQKEFTGIDDLLENSYGINYQSGQLFLYVYGKVSESKGIELSTIVFAIILLVAVAGISYIVLDIWKKKKKNDMGNKVTWHT